MHHLRTIVASLACLACTPAFAGDEELALPRAMTDAELEWAAKNPGAGFKALTAPPTGPLVATTEYSPSQAILFDGLYSVIGFVLAWFGLRAAAIVRGLALPGYRR